MQRNIQLVPIQLDSSIAVKMSMGGSMFQERSLMARSDIWHMIKIIRGTHYDKEEVLRAILAAIEPAELIPVKYQVSGEDTFFIARNCGPALEKLCKSNLIIKNGNKDPLILLITLGYALIHELKVNIQPLLLTALTKRFDPNKKSLDLAEFHKDPDIIKLVYCPLTQHRTFNHVLKLAKNALATFEHLNLQRNELTTLTAIENSGVTSIKYLDLRHNKLLSMNALSPLKHFCITKLWLDGNPLCENYSNPTQYIESARRHCPNLTQLDGVYIDTSGMPLTYTTYAKDEERLRLVKKFVSHFFSLYDQGDRTVLRGLYHDSAIYSISFGMPHSLAHKRGLTQFTASRNLLRTTDPNKRAQHIYCGQDNVLAGLKRVPRSYHDQSTFVYDLMHDDGACLIVNVGGMFKKIDNTPAILTFSRTFVLLALEEDEYNILNDQYYVDGAPEDVTPDKVRMKMTYDEFLPQCFSASEKRELIEKLGEVSTMNEEWCISYLEEADWNIRKAITAFMKAYKASHVPQHAFA